MKRLLLIAVSTAVSTLALGALARAPYTPPGAERAVLRFSWRMSVTARENCRPRTPEELASLPVHMRSPEVCTGDAARYSLVTRVGSEEADITDLTRGGVKGDRPLFVLEERAMQPGRHRVSVTLRRFGRSGEELLASIDTVLTLRPGAVQLVTLGSDGRTLTVLGSPRD